MIKVASLVMILGVVGACGGKSTGGAKPEMSAAVPCPEGEALMSAAAKAWGVVPSSPACVAVWVSGKPMWFVHGSEAWGADVGDDGMSADARDTSLWKAIVSPAGNVLWKGKEEVPTDLFEIFNEGDYRAVDLDQDGTSELVWIGTFSNGGEESTRLLVATVSAKGLTEATPDGGVSIEFDNSAATEDPAEIETCPGTLAVGTTEITITYPAGCKTPGTQVWVLRDGKLVERK